MMATDIKHNLFVIRGKIVGINFQRPFMRMTVMATTLNIFHIDGIKIG